MMMIIIIIIIIIINVNKVQWSRNPFYAKTRHPNARLASTSFRKYEGNMVIKTTFYSFLSGLFEFTATDLQKIYQGSMSPSPYNIIKFH